MLSPFCIFFLIQKSFAASLDENADDINLVESQTNEKSNTKKPTASIWQTFANIIDRMLFAALGLIYLFMIIDLLPERFFDKQPERTIEIIGY